MSDWLTTKEMTSKKGDTAAARARAAREERQRAQHQVHSTQSSAAQTTAASQIQRRARVWLALLRSRTLMRQEWDAVASAVGASPTAGQQLVLCTWLLRFFEATHDAERLRTLSRLIVEGMEQGDAPRMFAGSALRKELALHWVATLRHLLLTLCRMVTPSEAHVAAVLDEVHAAVGKGGAASIASAAPNAAATNARKTLSVYFGPTLRLLLLLAEPPKWKLVVQLNAMAQGQPAAQAILLMAASALHACAERLVSAAGSLAHACHTVADASLLGAAVAVAALPLQQEGPSVPPAEAVRALLLGGLLSVPALCARVATAAPRLSKGGMVWARVTESGAALAAHISSSSHLDADLALCIGANLLTLVPTQPPPSAPQLVGLALLLEALLRHQPLPAGGSAGGAAAGGGRGAAPSGGQSYFHQIRGWSPKAPSAAIGAHLDAVAAQLSALWSPRLVTLLYSEALAVPLGTRPVDGPIHSLPPDGLQALAARAAVAAQLHVTTIRALAPHRLVALARLAYSSHLVPAIWSLLRRLDATAAMPLARLTEEIVRDPNACTLVPLVSLLLEAGSHLLLVIADKELHADGYPFSVEALARYAPQYKPTPTLL